MARATAARRVACQLLGAIRRKQAYARDVMRTSDALDALDPRDRAFATHLVLGVVASRGLVDKLLNDKLKRGARLEPTVRDALRLGCYELLFMDTPPRAAVSQGVELARAASPRAAGLANAVLRRIANKDVPLRSAALERVRAGGDDLDDLALASGYPTWLLDAVAAQRSAGAARQMALSACEAPPVYAAANEVRSTCDEVRARLAEEGFEPVDEALPGSLRLEAPEGIAKSAVLKTCAAVVADLSAQRVARLAVPDKGGRVLEVGQGRGTKSILMQAEAHRRGVSLQVVGLDSVPYKVEVAARRMVAAGLADRVACVAFDVCDLSEAQLPDELAGPFDAVFVDAPCSGTGTLRRHPEICWDLVPDDVASLATLQLRMLCAASARVADGGTLCYATCSILSEEDEAVVQAFLSSPQGAAFELAGEPFLSLPQPNGPDGHFCARLTKTT